MQPCKTLIQKSKKSPNKMCLAMKIATVKRKPPHFAKHLADKPKELPTRNKI